MIAVKLVELLKVTELIRIPAPKLTVERFEKSVFAPVIVTDSVCACCALFGLTLVIWAVAVTVNGSELPLV